MQLQESLSLDQPKTLADLFVRANKYILQAEVMKIVVAKEDKEKKRKDREAQEEPNRKKEKSGDLRTHFSPRFKKYTPLAESRSTILAAIEGSGLFSFPPKADRPLGRDVDAYCRYHDVSGHSTEKCRDLMNRIEALVRDGKLNRFVYADVWRGNRPNYPQEERRYDNRRSGAWPRGGNDNRRGQGERPQENRGGQNGRVPPIDNQPAHPAINTISGGETLAGNTSSSRKAYARQGYQVNAVTHPTSGDEPITFTETDRGDVMLPHDDPLVISAVIAKHPIERILVDNGSSVNLIYWNCFQQMNLTADRLREVKTPLYSFSGEAVSVMGSVQLPVTLGTDREVTRMATFMVVKSVSTAYNVILGRPMLNDMRAVISPAYLLMKFPTPQGVGQVRGDQRKARAFYVSSIRGKDSCYRISTMAINDEEKEDANVEKKNLSWWKS